MVEDGNTGISQTAKEKEACAFSSGRQGNDKHIECRREDGAIDGTLILGRDVYRDALSRMREEA